MFHSLTWACWIISSLNKAFSTFFFFEALLLFGATEFMVVSLVLVSTFWIVNNCPKYPRCEDQWRTDNCHYEFTKLFLQRLRLVLYIIPLFPIMDSTTCWFMFNNQINNGPQPLLLLLMTVFNNVHNISIFSQRRPAKNK